MGDTVANDRFLKTPISFADLMPEATGDYSDSIPFLRPQGSIRLDRNLYNDPKYLKDQWTNTSTQPFNIDPNDTLRHEIIHKGLDKYKVSPNQINYPKDNSEGASLDNIIKKTLPSDEWIARALSSKKGEYLQNSNSSVLGPENTKIYQQYLLHALANSPSVHPKFKELLKRLGYGI